MENKASPSCLPVSTVLTVLPAPITVTSYHLAIVPSSPPSSSLTFSSCTLIVVGACWVIPFICGRFVPNIMFRHSAETLFLSSRQTHANKPLSLLFRSKEWAVLFSDLNSCRDIWVDAEDGVQKYFRDCTDLIATEINWRVLWWYIRVHSLLILIDAPASSHVPHRCTRRRLGDC